MADLTPHHDWLKEWYSLTDATLTDEQRLQGVFDANAAVAWNCSAGPDDFLAETIVLADLPPRTAERPDLVKRLTEIAIAAAGAKRIGADEKPGRIKKKADRLVEELRDDEFLWRLQIQLGVRETERLLNSIEAAAQVVPKLTALEIGRLCADAMRTHRVRVNTSKTGELVRVLESIRAATGFATNAQATARKLCK